jgi:hypothetical protein
MSLFSNFTPQNCRLPSGLTGGVGTLYEKVAVPVSAREEGTPYIWRYFSLQSRSESSLHQQIIGALNEAHQVFDSVTADKLVALTDLSNRQVIAVEQVVTEFYSYFDFTRLADANALKRAISLGASEEKLAYTAVFRWDEEDRLVLPNPELVYVGRRLNPDEVDLDGTLIMDAAFARAALPGVEPSPPPPPPPPGGGTVTPPPIGPGPGPVSAVKRRYSVHLTADKAKAYRAFRAIQNLTERADRMTVTVDVQAESQNGFDALWLRNAVEEPLDEADIEARTHLE